MTVEVKKPTPQVRHYKVRVGGVEHEVETTVEGQRFLQLLVDKLDDHEARLAAGGL